MNIENIPKKKLIQLSTPKDKIRKKPVSIEKGVYATIRGSVDEDTLLIEPTEDELENAFLGVQSRVRALLEPRGEYRIFCFVYLTSKQGPRVQIPAIVIELETTWEQFLNSYNEAKNELENKYIGGEEYNEQQLILSRAINIQFHYQVWKGM